MRVLAALFALGFAGRASADDPAAIDRAALVARHSPEFRAIDFNAPLTIGNGEFAFTADITGLQTFPDQYRATGMPIETMARWAWHSDPAAKTYSLEETSRPFQTANGSTLNLPVDTQTAAATWLRQNPHQLPLPQIGFVWVGRSGGALQIQDITNVHQRLDLWTGTLTSEYRVRGVPVKVTTACEPARDAVAIRAESELVGSGDLALEVAFPRGYDLAVKNTPKIDWSRPDTYQTSVVEQAAGTAGIVFRRDAAEYHCAVAWKDGVKWSEQAPHRFRLSGGRTPRLDCVIAFSSGVWADDVPLPEAVLAASARHWEEFWRSAAALDLSGSRNPLAPKLERRVVLSQYLTAVQCAGSVPPQESGLTCSTWYGKHHTEMIWWHTAHFALWGHEELLRKNLDWYIQHLPDAEALARERELRGARWAKMVGPEDRESPGGNALIVWNQPHVIYLCELLYRLHEDPAILSKYRSLVCETADAMASMASYDSSTKRYVLGPPLWIVQEIYDPARSQNPAFELAYWRWALQVAQSWRERLGQPRDAYWDDVIDKLSPLPENDGKYVALQSNPDTWTSIDSRHDHPEMLMALGVLPKTPPVDLSTMNHTLDAVLTSWDWKTKIWGWDYPMIAMTAARLGRPDVATEILLRDGPNNVYTANGHCPQSTDTRVHDPNARPEIGAYLPANGAFLAAVSLMVAGWDGCAERYPGFPKDGTWSIHAEGWRRLP